VSQFDQDSSVNIKNCQGMLERDSLSAELVFIYCHLSFLPGAIFRLEKQDFPCLRSSQLWKKQREKSIAFLMELVCHCSTSCSLFSTRIQVYRLSESVALSLRTRVVKVCPLESVPETLPSTSSALWYLQLWREAFLHTKTFSLTSS